jgi:methylmalonyl-CoA mutase
MITDTHTAPATTHQALLDLLEAEYAALWEQLDAETRSQITEWPARQAAYTSPDYVYTVRGREIRVPNYVETLSHLRVPKIALPRYEDWGDLVRWHRTENVPGAFPYTAGVYPFKRTGEDPTRMFAGEGGPERTNRRFHYVSQGMPAARLSTAFDSVTLYGEDPHTRPDIYGKIGNSGVSVASLDDAKKLYSGFDLCAPTTSVSMTINGPAPMVLAFFLNTAIDQQCEKYIQAHGLTDAVNRKIVELLAEKWRRFQLFHPVFEHRLGQGFAERFTVEDTLTDDGKHRLDLRFEVRVPAPPHGAEDHYFELSAREFSPEVLDATPVLWREHYLIPRFLYDYMPHYHGELPHGHNGLGLLLLGVTGDEVLPADVYQTLRTQALQAVRGTVQADILKEDQAQNTCIFSTEFALRMMGDIQQYFIDEKVRNFYSVSISGYHIAEAGANPISQLAFTLSNGFTFVEYYLSRGMHIDDFAPNLSFFFSNGMDPEYSVLGRVARRIWAKAIKHLYGGNERSQLMKYHIQTSGRSLHAQEIDFNDIRTTLQALYALYDNCNSLHTNAYDEAITTPTEESVRRAVAIQLIINRELGLAKNENPLQGSFIIEELTDLVEEAVYAEFRRISERGGVLGAMETMYQRNKIQEESLYYETLKHTGELPIIGVNTFLSPEGSPTLIPGEVIRSTTEEKDRQIANVRSQHLRYTLETRAAVEHLQTTAMRNQNIFAALMEAAKVCTLGQMSQALYDVGGQYRRNM